MTTSPEPARGQDDANPIGDSESPVDGDGDLDSSAASDDQPRLTVAAVARRLGVAPATLRTWDRRYGLGPSDHASGSHRRYGPDDIARLEQMQRALLRGASPAEAARYARSVSTPRQRYPVSVEQEPKPDSRETEPLLLSGVLEDSDQGSVTLESSTNTGGRGLRLTGAGPRARGLGRAALALDSWSVQKLLIESINADGVMATWRDTVGPVRQAINERRYRSGAGIEVLQLLVDSTATALRAVIANASPPLNPRPVMLASVPGEGQELELVALAAALAASRVGHRLFGPALPKEGLDAAIRRAAPAAVVLWSAQSNYASPRLLGELPTTRQRSRAFAAGAGWEPEALPPNVELLDSLDDAVRRLSETVLG
ncbi:MerR family transcriptional regulator [Parasphingorhabdus pacifica]